MKKYYRRLVWGLSILMSVIALGAMALMTKTRAEDIRDEFQRNVNDFAYKEKSIFSLHQPSHPAPSEEDDEDSPEFWNTFLIEKAYAAMAEGYGTAYAKHYYLSSETGYYCDFFFEGAKAHLSKSFLVLYDKNWDWEPLYAPIPEEFWSIPEVKADVGNYSRMIGNAVRITGYRYQGLVYIEKLEAYTDWWPFDAVENERREKYFTFDLSPYLHDVPAEAEPYEFRTSWFGYQGEDAFYNPSQQDLVDLEYHVDRENLAHKAERKLRQEAAELVASTLTPDYPDYYETCKLGLGTSYIIEMADRIPFDEHPTYYAFAYVTHPLREAMRELVSSYLTIFFVLIVAIVVLACLVYSLRENQERFERSRLAMTRAVAHELKTPLAVTKNYVENWEDIPEENRPEYRDNMVAQIDYVNGLVGDLLELSRMEAKAREPALEPVNLAELNEVVLRQLSSLTGNFEIIVNTPEDPESVTVQADLGMMRTVLMNLVTNAIRYGDKNIVIDISKKRDTVRYQIMNDGEPIPEEQVELIWDAFYTTKGSRSGRNRTGSGDAGGKGLAKDGTGLGLAITRQILELHDARYGCTSDAKGTTVWFEL